jgi:flagellar biosynthetic protein FliR
MDDLIASLLVELPGLAFAGVLIFARIGTACLVLPGFGEAEVPVTIRLAVALSILAALFPVLASRMPAVPDDPVRLCGLIVIEALTGLWLGSMARIWMLALPVAGQMIGSAIGIANVIQPDPMLGPQTSVLTRALSVAAPALIFATKLYTLPLRALAGSYAVVPPGTLLPIGDGVAGIVGAVGGMFALSLRLSAPFILAGVVWHVALGLLARVVPQLQIYFAALPAQILGGVVLFGFVAAVLLSQWRQDLGLALAALPGR